MPLFSHRFSEKKKHRSPAAPSVEEEFTFAEEEMLNYEKDPFLYSLSALRKEDIPLAHPVKKRTRKEKITDTLRSVMLVISVLVFIGSTVYLIDNFIQKARAENLYDEAAAEFAAAGLQFDFLTGNAQADKDPTRPQASRADVPLMSVSDTLSRLEGNAAAETPADPQINEEIEKLRAVLSTYKQRNEDVCGYISVPAVGIDYVVVQGEDNDYYLNHNYKGEPLVVGSIYMDYRCAENLNENRNTILYGHNIETPAIMFHGVTDFYDTEIFENERIYLFTMDGVFVYKTFAVYDTKPTSGYIRTDFGTDEAFAEFLTEMQKRSDVKNTIDLTGVTNILTLSTCTNYNNGRYALHAYLEEFIH